MSASEEKTKKASNHLVNEKSPYLLQHVGNPVNWYPWGETAFQKAKKEDKERGRNNLNKDASRLQGIFVRSSISKSSK